MGVTKTFGGIICLLISTFAADASSLLPRVPDDVELEAHQRWLKAVCRNPKYATIRTVQAPLYCFNKEKPFLGCYIRDTGEILISSTLLGYQYAELLREVVAHEMGHTLIDSSVQDVHTAPFTGIMSKYTGDSVPYITQTDIDLVCQKENCPCQHPE